MKQKPTATILTYCADPALLYGTLLTFKTLRVGFPTARVKVFDNGSHPEARPHIERAAKDAGCEYTELPRHHYVEYYRWQLLHQEEIESLVILDPDLVFWEKVEDWDFGDSLMAGRLMPRMHNLGITTVPRLHTSHLWVPDVPKLRGLIKELGTTLFEFDPVSQRTSAIDGKLYFWDTLAGLYNAMPANFQAFTALELDQYDHLFCGTHLPLASQGLNGGFVSAHESAARGDLAPLRGIWRDQQVFFESRVEPHEGPADRTKERQSTAAKTIAAMPSVLSRLQAIQEGAH